MTRSEELFAQAQVHIPGGVNSPVRAFRAVGGTPIFFERAQGAYAWDAAYADITTGISSVSGYVSSFFVSFQNQKNLGSLSGLPL